MDLPRKNGHLEKGLVLTRRCSLSERRKFTREFKLGVVKSILDGEMSLNQASRELDIRRNVLQRWMAAYRADPENAFPGSGQLKPDDEEIARLRRELRQAQLERDILKKAIAIFSKERK